MERDYAIEKGVNITPSPLIRFKNMFGYGEIRTRKEGLEIRVNDLDSGIDRARRIILTNSLPLMVKLSGELAVMRAFMVVNRDDVV